jgi:RNA polymerase sigma-70 factor (ECF subfamily)
MGSGRADEQLTMSETAFDTELARAQDGDEQAFATLYRRVNPGLLRFLRGTAVEAFEDVAADTWVEVVRALDRFVGDEQHFIAWIFTIAKRKAIDRGRYDGRRPVAPTDDVGSYAAAAPDTAELVERADATDAAIALVRTLPPDQAEVILLRVVAGLEIAHVAELVGKTNGAVRVLTHRGLKRLGATLAAQSVREQV